MILEAVLVVSMMLHLYSGVYNPCLYAVAPNDTRTRAAAPILLLHKISVGGFADPPACVVVSIIPESVPLRPTIFEPVPPPR